MKHIRKHEDKNLLEQGFTLIELLVVVAILGILAAVTIFAVGNLTKDEKKNACATEAATVETASDAFNAQAGRYPTLAEMQADTPVVGTVTVGGNLKTSSDARVGSGAASDDVSVQLHVRRGCPRLGLHRLSQLTSEGEEPRTAPTPRFPSCFSHRRLSIRDTKSRDKTATRSSWHSSC